MVRSVLQLCLGIVLVPELLAQSGSTGEMSLSGRVGYYVPTKGLQGGLMGSLEAGWNVLPGEGTCGFVVDLYTKQDTDVFMDVRPDISRQAFTLIPVSLHAAFRFLSLEQWMMEARLGVGLGISWYHYHVDYTPRFGATSHTSESHTGFGGAVFGTIFSRVFVGPVVFEQRLYLAPHSERRVPGNHLYRFNPTGAAFSIGYQITL